MARRRRVGLRRSGRGLRSENVLHVRGGGIGFTRSGTPFRGRLLPGRGSSRNVSAAYRLNRRMAAANRSVQARNAVKASRRAARLPSSIKRNGTEKQRARANFGKRKPMQWMKVVKMNAPRLVLTAQGLKNDDKALGPNELPGFFVCHNDISSTATSATMPAIVCSLNSTIQNNTFSSPIRSVKLHSTGRVEFPLVTFQSNTSTNAAGTTNNWDVESALTGGEPSGMSSRIINEWMAAKFVFYGCKTQQTRWTVRLVQATHDLAAVEEEDALLGAPGDHGDRYRDLVYGWWQNLLRPLVSSDIALKFNPSKRFMNNTMAFRTLRTWTYDVAPHLQTESDTSPNSVVANIFINDHRTLNYQWLAPNLVYDSTRTSATAGTDDLAAIPFFQNYQSTIPTNTTNPGYLPVVQPAPKARRYLVISCNNPTPVATGSVTVDDTPSFSMVLRKCELRGPNFAA